MSPPDGGAGSSIRSTAPCSSLPVESAVPDVLGAHGASVVGTGSHILELVEGRLDGIVSQKCGYIWDHAPAVALAIESGGHFSDPDGGSRADQHGGTYTNGHLHGALQAALSDGRVGLSGQPGHVHG
jgi:fructose-1,6-bisphosphatase/inositol monophosphatase family enzyme